MLNNAHLAPLVGKAWLLGNNGCITKRVGEGRGMNCASLILVFAFLANLNLMADDAIEKDISNFSSHWESLKWLNPEHSDQSWLLLKSTDAERAYRIAHFWLRKADIGTAEYQMLLSERLSRENITGDETPDQAEAIKIKYSGAVAEAYRCYLFDNADKVQAMISASLKSAQPSDIKKRLDEMQKARSAKVKP